MSETFDAALPQEPAPEPGWRDMASAPEDGTVVLVYRPDAGVFTAHFVEEDAHLSSALNPPEGDCYWFSTSGDDLTGDMPTHWMPLPSAPCSVSAPVASPLVGEDAAEGEIVETLAEEFSRLISEYEEPDSPTREEAWNLIADFAVENSSAIRAALSAASIPTGVKVKPLVWPDTITRGQRVHNKPALVNYTIAHYGGDVGDLVYTWAEAHSPWSEPLQSYEDAKAAAQADYERRILSALISPSPVGGQDLPVAGEIEALAEFLCSEFDFDLDPVSGAHWPEHSKDDGYRGGGYVKLQPADVQAYARDNAKRILTFLGQRSALSHPAPERSVEARQHVEYICGQWEKNQGTSSLTIAVRNLLYAISAKEKGE